MRRRVKVLLLVSMLGVGCSASPAPTPTAVPAVTTPITAPAAPAAKPADVARPAAPVAQAPATTPADPKAALTDAFRGWGNTKSFRARITTTGLQGGDAETKMDVVMPDRMHMTRTGGTGMEMIIVGDTAWMNLPTGWQKFGSGFGTDLTNPKKFEESIGASTETKLIGPDIFEGTPCLVYQYTTTLAPDSGAAGGALADAAAQPGIKPAAVPSVFTAKVWVGVADQLPRKLESADPNSPAKTTIVYYDFNAPITINPPA